MEKNTIKTQGDFDRQMNELQEELRNIMCPLKQREEDLSVVLGELSLKKTKLHIKLQEQKQYWANICEMKDIRDEKLKCLAEGRNLKMQIAHVWEEIGERTLELRKLRKKRKEVSQPFHDKMHELIVKYPKGTLPMVAK